MKTALALTSLYALLMIWWVWTRLSQGSYHIYDLGIHVEAMRHFAQGGDAFLFSRGLAAQADHFAPILFLFAPAFTIWPDPRTLLALQVLWLSLGAFPVYLMASRTLRSPGAAWGLMGLYLVNPAMVHALLSEFHASSLIVTPLLWACWAIEKNDGRLYVLALATAALCSESSGFIILALSFSLFLRSNRRWALATAVFGLSVVLVAHLWLSFYQQGESAYRSLYRGQEWDLAHLLGAEHVKRYFLQVMLPLAFLPILGPWEFLPALPTIFGNLYSWRPSQHELGYHYGAAIVPFVFWSSAIALARLRKELIALFLPLGFVFSAVFCLMPNSVRSQGDSEFTREFAALPDLANDRVCLSNSYVSLASTVRTAYLFPNPFQPAAWGNTPQALAEQAGNALEPASPGVLYRSAQRRPVQALVLDLRGNDHFPLATSQDRDYILEQVIASGAYQQSLRTHRIGVWVAVPGEPKP